MTAHLLMCENPLLADTSIILPQPSRQMLDVPVNKIALFAAPPGRKKAKLTIEEGDPRLYGAIQPNIPAATSAPASRRKNPQSHKRNKR